MPYLLLFIVKSLVFVKGPSRDKDGCSPNVRVLPWYLLGSLGILGDLGMKKTHKYPRVIGLIYRDFPFSGGPRYIQRTHWPPVRCYCCCGKFGVQTLKASLVLGTREKLILHYFCENLKVSTHGK